MRFRPAALFFLLVPVASACIPTRDNSNDPALAPIARLSVVDAGPGDETCVEGAVLASSYNAVTLVSRGRCLSLDARASSDPQNELVRWTFGLPAAGEHPAEERTIEVAPGFVRLDPAYRRALLIGTSLTFSLEVEDGSGFTSQAVASVLLENAAPDVSFDTSFTLPFGGLPWDTTDTSPNLKLTADASDADGDPPFFCWTLVGQNEACDETGTETGTIVESFGPAAGTYRLSVRVKDSESVSPAGSSVRSSRRRSASVTVGTPPLWEQAFDNRLSRIDLSDASSVAFDTKEGTFLDGPTTKLAFLSGNAGVGLVAWPSLALVTTDPSQAPLSRLASDSDGGRVWGVLSAAPDFVFRLFRPTASGIGSIGYIGETPGFLLPGFPDVSSTMSVDAAGRLWFTSPALGEVYMVSAPEDVDVMTAVPVSVPLPGINPSSSAVGRRPGTDEMWVLADDGLRPQFLVYEDDLLVPTRIVPLEFMYTFGFSWASSDELWIATSDQGVARLDVAALLAGDLSAVVLASAPDTIADQRPLTADPVSFGCWTGQNQITASGTVASTSPLGPLLVDPDGFGWFAIGVGVVRRHTADLGRTIGTSAVYSGKWASPNVAHGRLWQAVSAPRGLVEIRDDGSINRVLSRYVGTLGTASMPVFRYVYSAPAGERVWAIECDECATQSTWALSRLYLEGDLPNEEVRFDSTTTPAVAKILPYNGFFVASPAASQPFAWAVTDDALGAGPKVVRIDDGGFQDVLVPATPADRILGARSLRTNAYCAATMTYSVATPTSGDATLEMWRIPEGGSPVLLGSETRAYDTILASYYTLVFAAASPGGADPDMCWGGLHELDFTTGAYRSHIFGWDSGGDPAKRSLTVDGSFLSAHAVSPDELWLTFPALDAQGSGIRRHMKYDDGASTWSAENFPEPKAGFLIAPEAVSYPF